MEGEEGEWKGADGTEYKGSFYKNTFHGRGALTNTKKDVYVGDFIKHKREGDGEIRYANGETYDGEWVQDVFHGQGIYMWQANSTYDGQWVNGIEEGDGTLSDSESGIILKSTWHEGKPAQVPAKLQISMANLQIEPNLQIQPSPSQILVQSEIPTPLQTPKQVSIKQTAKPNSKENLKDNLNDTKDSKENLKENLQDPSQTPKEAPQQTRVATPNRIQPQPLYNARDPVTGLPLLCVEVGTRLPPLCISCLAADSHPIIPLLSIASASQVRLSSSQPPLPSPVSDPPRIVEGESGRLIGLVLCQLAAPTPLSKTSKPRSRKSGVASKPGETVKGETRIDVSKTADTLKIAEKEVQSQPSTPSRSHAPRRSRSLRTPDKMGRSPEPEVEEIKEPEEVLPPPPPVRQLALVNDEFKLQANILELVQINEIQDIVQQIEQLQSKLRNLDPPISQPAQSQLPSQTQPARPSSPSLPRPSSPLQNRPASPQNPPLPQKPMSPQIKPEKTEKLQTQQTVQVQRQQKLKELRQQLDTLQTGLLQHIKTQQANPQQTQGFLLRTQGGQVTFSDLVTPPNMESGDYLLTCVDFTPMPLPQSKAASFVATCSPDSIMVRVLPALKDGKSD